MSNPHLVRKIFGVWQVAINFVTRQNYKIYTLEYPSDRPLKVKKRFVSRGSFKAVHTAKAACKFPSSIKALPNVMQD